MMRLVAGSRRTVLYDEIDGVFGTAKAQEANAELCGFLNSGYRRGAKAYRCTLNGKKVEPEEFDAFAAVAVAGLRALPDTLASRSIFIHMKRRAPDEQIESFRHRYHPAEAKPIKDELIEWCAEHEAKIIGAEPELPAGIRDRSADCWEPLLAIADEAGGEWPKRAREAAVYLASRSEDEVQTAGLELLAHIKEAFGSDDYIATLTLLERLCEREESQWKDIRGKPLNDRGLASRLKPYGVKSKTVRVGDRTPKGYAAADFADAWNRYLAGDVRNKGNVRHKIDNQNKNVADVADVARCEGKGGNGSQPLEEGDDLPDLPTFLCRACDGSGCPTCQPEKFGLSWRRP
jgi:hypothetical protein